MTRLDKAIDDLTAAINVAVKHYNKTLERAQSQAVSANYFGAGNLTAHDMLDGNGRPMLLDASIALANARAALAIAEAARYNR